MVLEKQIQTDMVSAMKAKDSVRLASLRAIKAAILLAKTAEGGNGEVSDQDVVKIIQKLVKQRKESAEQYTAASRAELTAIIAQVGATNPSDMGKVMGVATKKLAGLADGRTISATVKKLLG